MFGAGFPSCAVRQKRRTPQTHKAKTPLKQKFFGAHSDHNSTTAEFWPYGAVLLCGRKFVAMQIPRWTYHHKCTAT